MAHAHLLLCACSLFKFHFVHSLEPQEPLQTWWVFLGLPTLSTSKPHIIPERKDSKIPVTLWFGQVGAIEIGYRERSLFSKNSVIWLCHWRAWSSVWFVSMSSCTCVQAEILKPHKRQNYKKQHVCEHVVPVLCRYFGFSVRFVCLILLAFLSVWLTLG